jgi:hypothetical protein
VSEAICLAEHFVAMSEGKSVDEEKCRESETPQMAWPHKNIRAQRFDDSCRSDLLGAGSFALRRFYAHDLRGAPGRGIHESGKQRSAVVTA